MVCIAKASGERNPFADAALDGVEGALLKGMKAALAKAEKARVNSPGMGGEVAQRAYAEHQDGRQAAALHKIQPIFAGEESTPSTWRFQNSEARA